MPAMPASWYWSAPLDPKPTGERRFRVQKWTRLLVLQINFEGTSHRMFSNETKRVTWWRDATPTDLLTDKFASPESAETA